MAFSPSEEDIAERAALLRRFKRLLEEKRAKFREYLAALEAQEKSIARRDSAKIEQQSILGEAIISEIYTIQRAIDPIESMYRDIYGGKPNAAGDGQGEDGAERHIPKLEADLDKLHADIERQNKRNRELLKSAMEQVRGEIAQLKKPYARKSVYSSESGSASIIDISW